MRNGLNKITNLLIALIVMFFISGCGEMLDNPTIDKDTGEDINLLIVDFNFFTTRATFKFVDIKDNSVIKKPAKMWFTGDNSNDIVNFTGKKSSEYITREGQMELTFDPNVDVSESSPLEFAVHVEIDGYQTFSQGIRINTEGKKTFELSLIKEGTDEEVITGTEDPEDGDSFIFSSLPYTKSASFTSEENHKVQYAISKTDLINFKDYYGRTMFSSVTEAELAYKNDPEHFIRIVIGKNTGFPITVDRMNVDGSSRLVAFHKLETGTLQDIVITGRRVADLNNGTIKQETSFVGSPAPDAFGLASFEGNSWSINGTTKNHDKLKFTYTVASASLSPICATGCNINFTSDAVSSFSIDADIYNTEGQKIKSINFKGSFPESFTLENVPEESAKVVFRSNNPAFQIIPDLNVDNLCNGNYNVEVKAAKGFNEYQIALKALCADNPSIAVAPTYSGEYRIKDSNDPWQGIDMVGGVVDMLAKPNENYELRLLWDEEWEQTTFSTAFDANGNYINTTRSKVETELMEDGRTRFKIEHTFEQSICDDMGW